MVSPTKPKSGQTLIRSADMIDQKFKEVERAAQEFKDALLKFRSFYDPETVGIDEFCEQIDEVLFDIDQELQE